MYLPVERARGRGGGPLFATGLLSGLLPALSAMRLSIVNALRRV